MAVLKPADAKRIILRRDGSSTFASLGEHFRRNGRDLSNCVLSEIDFSGLNLRGFRLTGADLSRCKFTQADLSHADLADAIAVHANCESVNFDGTVLSRVDFSDSVLPGASFRGAEVSGTRFDRCDLSGSIWCSSPMMLRLSEEGYEVLNAVHFGQGARLDGAFFRRANLRDAQFAGPAGFVSRTRNRLLVLSSETRLVTVFHAAELKNLDFSEADLTNAAFGENNFRDGGISDEISIFLQSNGWLISSKVVGHDRMPGNACQLEKCDFTYAVLANTDFSSSTLRACKFSKSNLVNADFSFATCDSTTLFPPEFRLPDSAERLPPPFSLLGTIAGWFSKNQE